MDNISATDNAVKRLIPDINHKINFLTKRLEKSQGVIVLFDMETATPFVYAPMATRGNKAYAARRQERIDELQYSVNQLVRIDGDRTNAFLITLTYSNPQYAPPQSDIKHCRRLLRKFGVSQGIFCIECHQSGAVHIHAVLIADEMRKFYGRAEQDGKRRYRCNSMREIVRKAWTHGFVDVQAINDPHGAGQYVMKEIGKFSHIEDAVKKWKKGEELTKADRQRVHLFYFAIRHRRRTLSVSRGLPKPEVAGDTADLITLMNNRTERQSDLVVLIVPKAIWWALFARPPPHLTQYHPTNREEHRILLEMARKVCTHEQSTQFQRTAQFHLEQRSRAARKVAYA